MSFTESLFVEHATNKELGIGKIIGDFPVMAPTENGQTYPVILAAVAWQNSPQPAYQLHQPEELINATDLFDEDDETEEEEGQEEVETAGQDFEGEVLGEV